MTIRSKMESFRYMVIVLVLLAPGGRCQGLAGSNYIEQQLLCALDKAPCDIFGEQIKQALPDIIGKNCANCDQRRLASAQRVARFVQSRYPEAWAAIVDKYSSQNYS